MADQRYGQGKDSGENGYATLLTRPSYLAGAILLAYSLNKHSPSTTLLILHTPDTLPAWCIKALESEAKHSNCILRPIQRLPLPTRNADRNGEGHGIVTQQFIDSWTKLRVFQLNDMPFRDICFLDADVLVLDDPSPIVFSSDAKEYLTQEQGKAVLATHVCLCNLDDDASAPASWNRENCAYTGLTTRSAPESVVDEPETHGIFNSGAFVFRNSKEMSEYVFESFESMSVEELRELRFPDREFLNRVFCGRWRTLSWSVNALKTWRYLHPNMWADEEVRVLHYIVDKPWAKRGGSDGKGGYKGDDGVTHSWWWEKYGQWIEERKAQGEEELLGVVAMYVAGEGRDGSEEKGAIGGRAQDFAQWKKSGEARMENEGGLLAGKKGDEAFRHGLHGPILRKPILGERVDGSLVEVISYLYVRRKVDIRTRVEAARQAFFTELHDIDKLDEHIPKDAKLTSYSKPEQFGQKADGPRVLGNKPPAEPPPKLG
ncbi:nucleotide-diphospho-sugar transferase [Lojkania enalia]|uniref:Nucleotide-diphospho-sugar transferase n=1 Tax=Lojkania enalia TaxID=147567 RepID=A0A9P4MY43_9PLEO|nr:nucleotide-diphospho-sugar transferase [Didymosphaeria enalia]